MTPQQPPLPGLTDPELLGRVPPLPQEPDPETEASIIPGVIDAAQLIFDFFAALAGG